MKEHKKILKLTEILLILVVWLVIILAPILFKESKEIDLIGSLSRQMETIIPLLLLFFVNRFILVPLFLFKGQSLKYIFSVLGIIIMLSGSLYVFHRNFSVQDRPNNAKVRMPNNQLPRPIVRPPDRLLENRRPQPIPQPMPPFANFLILSILVVGFDTGLRSTLRWFDVEQEKVKLEKENIDTQLVALRNQISPHFFMNTLNNIHSLVDIDTEEAKNSIIKLSKMMRYLLYETESEQTTLKREIEFIQSYVDLMRLRFNDKVNIMLNLPKEIPNKTLPPFLFISLIENAFKHGISYKDKSFIQIDLIVGANKLLFTVKNSKSDEKQNDGHSGIGVENTRRRLDLIYGNRYNMDIIENDTQFTVNLSIPI
ncbi:sensor histidine kinase [Tenuifilum thalassicum]|nr:histidine kinase [Tenuifilum thalassicum]